MNYMDEDEFSERAQKIILSATSAPAGEDIVRECFAACERLLEKNISYGNSALEPVRIFSRASTQEQILVRIDDKLSRLMRGTAFVGDNDIDDLLGYLLLLKVSVSRDAG
jgi:hypothetical protein